MGTCLYLQVLWEVYSSTSGNNLPKVYDLILLANIPNKVDKQPSKRRPKTGTDVILLTGAEGKTFHFSVLVLFNVVQKIDQYMYWQLHSTDIQDSYVP